MSSRARQKGGGTAAQRAARLESLLRRQARLLRQQESLRTVIESISSELELHPLLDRILRHACELIGADNGTIGLVDHARNVVRTAATYQMPPNELSAEMPPGVGVAGQVLLTRRPVVLRRYGDLPHPTQLQMIENAVVGVPICWRDRMIGFFGIGRAARPSPGARRLRARPFTRDDVETLTLFARHAAIAIENAHRYHAEQERTERFALIARVGRLITADLRLDDMLQRAADAIHELLGYPNVAIPLIAPEEPDTLVLNTVGGYYKEIIRREYRLPVSEGIMGAAVRSGKVVLVNDVASDPRYIPTPGAVGIHAELAVPILVGSYALGVVNVESGEPFDEEDAGLLQIVADQLAVAIENARLYATAHQAAVLEERHRLARELHDSVTQHLFSLTLVAQSVSSVYRRDPAEGDRRITRLLELSQAALREMRALLAELRPSEPLRVTVQRRASELGVEAGIAQLRRLGLEAALRSHVDDVARDGLWVELRCDGYQPQPTPHEEALFRIAQEALNNVVKHARAKHVRVHLTTDDASTRVTINDDGVGFDGERVRPASTRTSGGFGLWTMRERAEAVGGTVLIRSAPGRGTVVEVTVPAGRECVV
jgi:signal transduction histidine kinase